MSSKDGPIRQTNYQTIQKTNYSLWSNHTLYRTVKNWTATHSFMEAGNTILLFKENPKGMFGLETEFVETDAVNVFDPAGTNYSIKS